MLKGNLPRVMNYQVYFDTKINPATLNPYHLPLPRPYTKGQMCVGKKAYGKNRAWVRNGTSDENASRSARAAAPDSKAPSGVRCAERSALVQLWMRSVTTESVPSKAFHISKCGVKPRLIPAGFDQILVQ